MYDPSILAERERSGAGCRNQAGDAARFALVKAALQKNPQCQCGERATTIIPNWRAGTYKFRCRRCHKMRAAREMLDRSDGNLTDHEMRILAEGIAARNSDPRVQRQAKRERLWEAAGRPSPLSGSARVRQLLAQGGEYRRY
jgi:hypothetical protein